MALRDKLVVRLTPEHRQQLDRLVSSGKHPARVLTFDRTGWLVDWTQDEGDDEAFHGRRPSRR